MCFPCTVIAMASLQMIPGVDLKLCRLPELEHRNFLLLAAHGMTDLEQYSVKPGTKNFIPDFFVD